MSKTGAEKTSSSSTKMVHRNNGVVRLYSLQLRDEIARDLVEERVSEG